MNETDQHTCTNLRLVGIIKKNQRLRINRSYNVTDVVDNTPYSAAVAFFSWDTWYYTKYATKKIFTEDTPKLCAKLIQSRRAKELKNIENLLTKASDGLINLKIAYKNDELALAHIDSIVEDYIIMQINDIKEYFVKNSIENITQPRSFQIPPDNEAVGCPSVIRYST